MKDVIALLNDQRSELLDSVARIDAADRRPWCEAALVRAFQAACEA